MSHKKYQTCIEACYNCAMMCDHCCIACLQEENVNHMIKCIELDVRCAPLCRLAASYMSKGDLFVEEICRLCAEVCDACAAECSKHKEKHCLDCAEACKKCAEECRKMAA